MSNTTGIAHEKQPIKSETSYKCKELAEANKYVLRHWKAVGAGISYAM